MKKIDVNLGADSYSIHIEAGLLTSAYALLRQNGAGKNIVLITDSKVNALYGNSLAEQLTKKGMQVHCFAIPAGERYKSARSLSRIYDWMMERHFPRDITLVTLGGGVVGDLGGFVAATYMRGVIFIQIPTTLLAQVDSSVGGKVGINHKLGKNVIGAFYQPKTVIIDPMVLRTLPEKEIYCGLAEVIKYGYIADKKLLSDLEQNFSTFFSLNDWSWTEKIISRCCQLKADIVEKDEKENGLRRILNFGHTIGHALESATKYKYFTHGEAVLWGMLGAAEISFRRNYITSTDLSRIVKIIDALKKPPVPTDITAGKLSELMLNDKKVRDNQLNFVLLKEIGHAIVEIVPDELLSAGIDKILSNK